MWNRFYYLTSVHQRPLGFATSGFSPVPLIVAPSKWISILAGAKQESFSLVVGYRRLASQESASRGRELRLLTQTQAPPCSTLSQTEELESNEVPQSTATVQFHDN